MSGSAECRNQPPRGKRALQSILIRRTPRSPERVRETRAFLLTKTYMDAGDTAIHWLATSALYCYWHWGKEVSVTRIGLPSGRRCAGSNGFVRWPISRATAHTTSLMTNVGPKAGVPHSTK